MERFIHRQNLELYRKLLADPNDKDEARHQSLTTCGSRTAGIRVRAPFPADRWVALSHVFPAFTALMNSRVDFPMP
jgi:hypothetical protein